MKLFNSEHNSLIEVNTLRGKCFINVNSILYLKAMNKFTIIILLNKNEIVARHLLKDMEKILPQGEFYRCHKSYIINFQHIESFCSNVIVLKSNIRIVLSRHNKQQFIESLKKITMKQSLN